MRLNDYFWGWLVEAHLCGYITDTDIDDALADPRYAFQILQECFDESLSATAKMSQEALRNLKKFIEDRRRNID